MRHEACRWASSRLNHSPHTHTRQRGTPSQRASLTAFFYYYKTASHKTFHFPFPSLRRGHDKTVSTFHFSFPSLRWGHDKTVLVSVCKTLIHASCLGKNGDEFPAGRRTAIAPKCWKAQRCVMHNCTRFHIVQGSRRGRQPNCQSKVLQ